MLTRQDKIERAVAVVICIIVIIFFSFLSGYEYGNSFPCNNDQVLLSTDVCVSATDHDAHVGG